MELFVKNMVCDRCIMMVKQRLTALAIDYSTVELGEIKLNTPLTNQQFLSLKDDLHVLGFELLDDRKASIVTQIKSCIIKYIHCDDDAVMNKKLSVLLSEKLGIDYNYLSALFSSVEGITIEKYVILQRIERAKELLAYNELSLNEIADKLCYSSVQHLSQQFKKVTGLTPSQYKQSKEFGRKPLDQVGS
ncbi:helix-turn-helix transcriptional regulator [Ilyomonas limi]|uniref:Helix-turn-helix transcriptional regulator n=1 Tax=Ilyomonas limi TaxID=2575867 RepID=A0A4U3LDH7_9BACT|nr:AraC family transcriptional regulator [Ilyomonas limi]TKK71997.1 helix-turn-helix transcriptional regulator [Ilyomonas limi]